MHTRMQAGLMKVSPIAHFILFVPLVFVSGLLGDPDLKCAALAAFFLLVFFIWIVVPYLPLRCDTPGCPGRVHRTTTRLSPIKLRLHYSCPTCGDTYEVEVFAPENDFRP